MSVQVYPILSLEGGQKIDKPKQLLPDIFSSDSRDVLIKKGYLQARLGLDLKVENAVTGAILHQFVYRKFNNSWLNIIFTPSDVYYIDTATLEAKFITPIENSGTVDVTNDSAVVTGNGTTWQTDGVEAGDYFRIGGLNDASAVWYEIDSVDSETQITLTSNYAEDSDTAVAYTIRKIFTTESSATWRCAQFTDASLGDIVAMTNGGGSGVDEKLHYWTGTGQLVEISGSYVCKDVVSFKDRVILINTYEGGSWQSQRFRFSNVADITTFDAADLQDIPSTAGIFIGGIVYEGGDYLILFKDDSKFLIRWIGGDAVFDNELINHIGVNSKHSIVLIPMVGVMYFGSDLRFHIFNGSADPDISSDIWDFITRVDPNSWHKVYARYITYEKQVRILVPYGDTAVNTYCLVYNPVNRLDGSTYYIWHIWQYQKANSMCSIGEFWTVQDYYVDEDPWQNRYVDEWDGYYDDREALENSPLVMLGGDDGYLRQVDSGLDDDGETYTPIFVSKRLDFKLPFLTKRLWRVEPWLYSETGKSISLYVRKNDESPWGSAKTIDISNTDKEVIKTAKVVDTYSDVFDIKISASAPWRLIGFLFYYMLSKRR